MVWLKNLKENVIHFNGTKMEVDEVKEFHDDLKSTQEFKNLKTQKYFEVTTKPESEVNE